MSVVDTFFSVIMSCYNSELYIEQSVFSVISQNYCNWELIVVDDCSTDATLSILHMLASIDARISIYGLPCNQGPAFARNFAASHAQGDWLAILDSDDIFLPNKLHDQNHLIINSTDELVLVASDSIRFDSTSAYKSVSYPHSSYQLKSSLFNMSKFPPHSSIAIRTSTFLQLGGYNVSFEQAEDYELFLRISSAGVFSSVMKPLIKYRVHPTSLSNLVPESGYSIVKYGLAANILWRLNNSVPFSASESSPLLAPLLEFLSFSNMGTFLAYFERFRPKFKAIPATKKVPFLMSEFIDNPLFLIASLLFFLPWCRSVFLSLSASCYYNLRIK